MKLRPQSLKSSRTLGPGIAIAVVIAMGVYSWFDGEAYRSAAARAEVSRLMVERLQRSISLLVDAESGQRGYLLTGDPQYLEPYEKALPLIASSLESMNKSLAADPEDAQRLIGLMRAKVAEMVRTVELRRTGDAAAALAVVRSEEGRIAMDQIRALDAHLVEGENSQYRELTESMARHGYKTRIIILGGAILLALLLWITSRRVNQLVAAQRSLIADLDRSRDLETRGKAALDTTLRSIADAVITTDSQGRIRYMNRVAEQLTGWTSSAAEEHQLSDVFRLLDEPTRAAAPDLAGRVLSEARVVTGAGPLLLVSRDGREMPVEYSGAPLHDSQGALSGVALAFRDVTERRGLEEQLRQSQKLEAVGQLAGGIAHDFNNLLTVIEGYAEMIRSEEPADGPQSESAQEILVAARRAASLTRQLLAFSRRQVLSPIRLNLNDNVANTHRMLARLIGENIEVLTKPAPGLWDVVADPGQIDQIILNLAVNARDAMPGGGRLTIETANLELEHWNPVHYPEMAPGKYVRLSLRDTGHGMDARTRSRIFEPFFTTKEVGRGTGLGLSTVYGIVRQSEGHIQVESEPGLGAAFHVFLPATQNSTPAEVPAPPKATLHIPSETILLVEDDATVRNLVSTMLKSMGYRVLSPGTPQQAIGICADSRIDVDLVLTDMVLPETDGIAVARQAVALRPYLKVLFMSGYTEHPVLQRPGLEAGAFLHKPFTKSALAAKVREVLEA